MGETFYTALGVDDDADTETIHRAYRELVKETHPDVSDDPDAPERFKRLTTAREVLVDGDERARYDRLGHSKYVARHVDSGVWKPVESSGETGTGERRSESTARAASTGGTDDYDRTAWLGEDGPSGGERTTESGHRKRRRARATGHVSGGGENWQQASQAYRRADTDVTTAQRSTLGSVARVLQQVGPWLFIHVVFILSALATAWLTFVQADSHLELSLPVIVGGALVLGLTVFVSVLHVISQVYS
jgi:curved DNA-binding protein CbpA